MTRADGEAVEPPSHHVRLPRDSPNASDMMASGCPTPGKSRDVRLYYGRPSALPPDETGFDRAGPDFLAVPMGEPRINRELPVGYDVPVVFCRIDFEDRCNVVPAAMARLDGG